MIVTTVHEKQNPVPYTRYRVSRTLGTGLSRTLGTLRSATVPYTRYISNGGTVPYTRYISR
jgi:hypothetical protein